MPLHESNHFQTPLLNLAASSSLAKAAAVEIQFTPLQKLSFPIHFWKLAQVGQHATTVLIWSIHHLATPTTSHLSRETNQTNNAWLLQRPCAFSKSFRLFHQILQHAPWVGICLLCRRNSENGYVTCPRLQRACGCPPIFSAAFIPLSTSLTAAEKWHF